MIRLLFVIIVSVIGFSPAFAGLYCTFEPVNSLPAKWRGFLPDHRSLRMAAVEIPNQPSPRRERYLDQVLVLEYRVQTANDALDLSYALIRLGRFEQAIGVLRTARRKYDGDFKLASNLGTAYQLTGDLESAILSLQDASKLATKEYQAVESLHLSLVLSRKREGKTPTDAPDAIIDLSKASTADLAIVQSLALALPADGRLLWLLSEVAAKTGDVRMAANMLDGCVGEFGMNSAKLRERRSALRKEADALADKEETQGHQPVKSTIEFASPRPLGSAFDASKMPAIKNDRPNPLPWPAILETTIEKNFRPKFIKYVDSLDGKPIVMTGYPANSGDDAEGQVFLLTEYPIGCWFCESPEPVSIVKVELKKTVEPGQIGKSIVKIQGTLKLNRNDPEKFLFTISDASFGAIE